MRTKWTPGKWKVEQYDQPVTICGQNVPCFEVESEDDECWIAKVQDHCDCIGTPEGNANAHLIAAAPELYEALAELHDWIQQSGQSAHLAKARAALAKARGKS
jgi:hypothetical protein